MNSDICGLLMIWTRLINILVDRGGSDCLADVVHTGIGLDWCLGWWLGHIYLSHPWCCPHRPSANNDFISGFGREASFVLCNVLSSSGLYFSLVLATYCILVVTGGVAGGLWGGSRVGCHLPDSWVSPQC